ncbi:hypothetical protein P7C70_g3271, partial [Phenoliferia sp. Uapishka_3]
MLTVTSLQRSRDVQRAFRARRAEKISTLEARVKHLEDENALLRSRLGMKEAEPWSPPGDDNVNGADIVTPAQVAPQQREGYANQFAIDSAPPQKRWSTVPQASVVQAYSPSSPHNLSLLAPSPSPSSATTGYDPNFPSPTGLAPSNLPWNPTPQPPYQRSSLGTNPPSRSGTPPSSIILTEDQQNFLTICCSVPPPDASTPTPYQLFCCGLMQGLHVTGKGRSARMSLDNPTLPPRDISATEDFEDSPQNDPIRAGFLSPMVAWNILQPCSFAPNEIATLLVQAAGGPGDGTPMGGGQGLRCEPNHGVIISEQAIKATKSFLETPQPGARSLQPSRVASRAPSDAEYDPTSNYSFVAQPRADDWP